MRKRSWQAEQMLQLIPLGACAHLFIPSDGGEWLFSFFASLQEKPHGRSRYYWVCAAQSMPWTMAWLERHPWAEIAGIISN